jgi:hypothetical protein
MNIISATSKHVDYISTCLSGYFSKANHFFEYPRFKDSYELMSKHVSKRIEVGVDGFVYFVAEDEAENAVGFVNLLIDENNVGSILVTIADTKEIAEELIQKSIEYFKENGVSNVQIEVFDYEKDLKEIYAKMGVKEELINSRLSI